jgi:hypothetical protein
MNISIETLTIFVFLIPGFVSSLIINTMVNGESPVFNKVESI